MKKRLTYLYSLAIFMGVFIFLSSCSKDQEQTIGNIAALKPSEVALQNNSQFVQNEVLVKFKSGTSESNRLNLLGKVNATASEKILTKAMKRFGDNEGITLIKTPMTVVDAIGRLKGLAEIEFVEPNYIYTTDAISNDTYYTNGSLWGMYGDVSPLKTNVYGSQAAEAWAAGHTGSGNVYIGIIDEGYMYSHEDLAVNAGTNPYETAGDGIDNDANGYIDDVYGWDFDGGNNSVFDGVTDDHGTHVAGTIGAIGGNGKGVAGVCWNVKLLSGKFLGRRGGTTVNAILAVDYFTELKKKGLNIVATNNSWGGGGFSQGLYDAIERANAAGILFVAAAGNESTNIDVTASYPAGYSNSNIIAVASITNTGGLSSFSNYGATKVDIGAPGSGIYSSVPVSSKGIIVSGYASYSGTSMATPHVTGAVALYAASNPGASVSQIINAIYSSGVATPSLVGKCVTGKRLNASGF